jgi:hypothetical protein
MGGGAFMLGPTPAPNVRNNRFWGLEPTLECIGDRRSHPDCTTPKVAACVGLTDPQRRLSRSFKVVLDVGQLKIYLHL